MCRPPCFDVRILVTSCENQELYLKWKMQLKQGLPSYSFSLSFYLSFITIIVNFFPTSNIYYQRLGRQNRHMGLWPLGFQRYGPFLKSMGHYSNGVGQKKRNIGIFVSDVTFHTSIIQYREVNIIIK